MQTTFTLDTTGYVDVIALGIFKLPGHLHAQTTVQWSDLAPFTQGYIEALFATFCSLNRLRSYFGFSDLAPETLARIIADCEGFVAKHPGWGHPDGGRLFWTGRNGPEAKVDSLFGQSCRECFPPLTVTLGDDGKVRFA